MMAKIMLEKSTCVPFRPQAHGTLILPSSPLALPLHTQDNRKQEWKFGKRLRILHTGLGRQAGLD